MHLVISSNLTFAIWPSRTRSTYYSIQYYLLDYGMMYMQLAILSIIHKAVSSVITHTSIQASDTVLLQSPPELAL